MTSASLTTDLLHEKLATLSPGRRRALWQTGRKLVADEKLESDAIRFSFQTLPLVMEASRVQSALTSCEPVIAGLIELERRALAPGGERIRQRLVESLDPAGRRLLELCSSESAYSLERRFRRVDAMLDPGAPGLRVLEVNQAAPAFLHFHDAIQRIASEVLGQIGFEHRPALLAPRVAAWLLGEYRERMGAATAPAAVAVVSEAGYPFKQLELPAFTAACEAAARAELGCDTAFRLCMPHELRLRGGRMWLGQEKIDLVWRNSALLDSYAGREHDIEDYLRILARHDEHLIVNSTGVWLTLTKHALSFLSSEAELERIGFAAERRGLLAAVPRTVSLAAEPDMADEVIRSREEWISKPAAGSFSRGFEPGHWHSDDAWRDLVRERSRPDFVFQRRVRPARAELVALEEDGQLHRRAFQHDFCPHHVDGAFSGTALVRGWVDGAEGPRIVPLVVSQPD